MKLPITICLIHLHSTWLQTALIIVGVLILIQVIQRLTRKKNPDEQATLNAWHTDPANWKAGIFYFNPKDHRIFPPKRIAGLGWTMNFANPLSILTAIGLILFTVALYN